MKHCGNACFARAALRKYIQRWCRKPENQANTKSGQVEIKNDKDGNLGASIGRKNFPENKILENYNSLIESIKKEKPNGIKGEFILSTFMTSTMGISYRIKSNR